MSFYELLPGYTLYVKGQKMWGIKVQGGHLCTVNGTLGKLPATDVCKAVDGKRLWEEYDKLVAAKVKSGFKMVLGTDQLMQRK